MTSIAFTGNAPSIGQDVFYNDTLTAQYPANNSTWTSDVLQQYGGTVTWKKAWTLDDEGTLTISGKGAMTDYDEGTAPWDAASVKAVVIEQGVTSIGSFAFSGCIGLTSVTIPSSVTSIGASAFSGCTGLTSIVFTGNAPSIGQDVFHNDTLMVLYPADDATWTESVMQQYGGSITWGAYSYTWSEDGKTCTGSVSCTAGDSTLTETATVTSAVKTAATCTAMGTTTYTATFTDSHFSTQTKDVMDIEALGHNYENYKCTRCGAMKSGYTASGTCGDHLTWALDEAGTLTITGTGAMTNYTISYRSSGRGGVKMTWTAPWPAASIKSVVIEHGVTSIGNYAFYNCSSLTSVTVPDTVTSIGNYAFSGCTGLTSIVFTGNAPSFGQDVFYNDTLTAQYPANDDTWTDAVKQTYGGIITWEAYTPEHVYGTPVYTWSDDGKTCTATVSCTAGDSTLTENGTITSAAKTAATCTEKGITTYTATFTNELFGTQTKDVADIPALGHSYGEASYSWSEDGKSCTATVSCTAGDSTLTENGTITSAEKTAATCTEMGTTTYTATFKNTDHFSAKTKDVQDIPALGHLYGVRTYTWSEDGKTCKATVSCTREGCTEKVTEDGIVTSTEKTAATCTEKGITTYTAKFTNKLFGTQTKDVADLAELGHDYGTPEYTWNEKVGMSTCTASVSCTREGCTEKIVEIGTMTSVVKTPATTETKGTTTYTATFMNEFFETQTKDVEDLPLVAAITTTETVVSAEVTVDTSANKAEGTLPADTFTQVTEADTAKPVTIDAGEVATITLDSSASSAIANNAGENAVAVSVAETTETSAEAVQAVEATGVENAKVIEITMTANGNEVFSNDNAVGGTASVTIPYTQEDSSKNVAVYYVDGDYKEPVPTYYDSETKKVTFTTGHFSTYVIGEEEVHSHMYGTPVYTWSEDYTTCTASVSCTAADDTITENGSVTSETKTAATCGESETTTYTATFENELFTTQTKVVESTAVNSHLYGKPVYTWSKDGKSCTASVSCTREGCNFTLTEEATITSRVKYAATFHSKGTTEYTATFRDSHFTTQTKNVRDIPVISYSGWGSVRNNVRNSFSNMVRRIFSFRFRF